MTRPGKSTRGQALAGRFAGDPVDAVLGILRKAKAPLRAADIKKALESGGVADVDAGWRRVQPRLAAHANVIRDAGTYAWTEPPGAHSAAEALDLLAGGGLSAAKAAQLAALVRAVLDQPAPERPAPHRTAPDKPAPEGRTGVDREEEARRRQADIDAVRALAELAGEVEELAVNEVRTAAMVHRVRARVQRSGLEPIGRAGDETTFDRKRHKPISGSIRDGAPVVVVRPGYVWKAPTEDVLIAKAIVEE